MSWYRRFFPWFFDDEESLAYPNPTPEDVPGCGTADVLEPSGETDELEPAGICSVLEASGECSTEDCEDC